MPTRTHKFAITFYDTGGIKHTVTRSSTRKGLDGSSDVLRRFKSHATCAVEGVSLPVNHRALTHVRPA